ncbi:c-type cytochrome biogenesis protein CcmI [Pseudoruegeria sp. HB172150]|uniref:c-type cytochrome biogenesis protein CcmI n=1 Tax=Pseudoruegeria sp. HB172150 TaxID=2721164 RepID=UPI0015553040|nr:c-type cytochrome biogenesis protein CcmI [Pseudoruegeria sp. HB172150]
MLFWIVSSILVTVIAVLLVLALMRTRASDDAPSEAFDMQVYRDQLKEVDRDLARGTMSTEETERVRVEVSRRLLEADRAAQIANTGTSAPSHVTYAGAGLTVLLLAGAFLLYRQIGAPGYPDLPLNARLAAAEDRMQNRPSQEMAETAADLNRPGPPELDANYAELMTRLRNAMEENPDDQRGLQLLAANEARIGNFAAAYAAQQHLIEVKGDAATATDYSDAADMMILAADGYVSPEAERLLQQALTRDPGDGPARYYYGLLYAQTGRPDLAFRTWRALLADSPPDAPWVSPLTQQMPALARAAGERWTMPTMRGPTAEDIEAAGEMTAEERQGMIRGMVDGLAARLADEGGPPEDWARLIGALGVLGETEQASAIWTEAQTVFADLPDGLATVRAAAVQAGVAQ